MLDLHSADASNLPKLNNVTLDELNDGLNNGYFNSVHLVKAYRARILEVNDEFRAVLEVNDDAEMIAQSLDEERLKSGSRG